MGGIFEEQSMTPYLMLTSYYLDLMLNSNVYTRTMC